MVLHLFQAPFTPHTRSWDVPDTPRQKNSFDTPSPFVRSGGRKDDRDTERSLSRYGSKGSTVVRSMVGKYGRGYDRWPVRSAVTRIEVYGKAMILIYYS